MPLRFAIGGAEQGAEIFFVSIGFNRNLEPMTGTPQRIKKQ
jgi:hypothetical protein